MWAEIWGHSVGLEASITLIDLKGKIESWEEGAVKLGELNTETYRMSSVNGQRKKCRGDAEKEESAVRRQTMAEP